ncbi:PPC domain-containing DNA-binding protein [Pyrococcus yayanosii]|uniref:Putative DNA-binding protein n=1 Tax=Pyrococcus yayanosii (strain CH1 / JCM 16557) TaxID=529709 RepID=F8AHL0_PYRYC|nr:PPC domain-containing DNA-binding protein [Pyrococcus yayanosii]AEH25381.1 Putative DNA-binding protein [Pyrococcus yayanosii CH1]
MEFNSGRVFLFRVPEGEELVTFITKFAEEKGIKAAVVSAIGSLKSPRIGYFDEERGEYKIIKLEGTYELVSLMGNISLKEGGPFAHLHAALGDSEGRLYGGHLFEGEVFVAEVFVQELIGEPLERKPRKNGLSLWDAITRRTPGNLSLQPSP